MQVVPLHHVGTPFNVYSMPDNVSSTPVNDGACLFDLLVPVLFEREFFV